MIVIDRLLVGQQLRDMMKTFCYCSKLFIFLLNPFLLFRLF